MILFYVYIYVICLCYPTQVEEFGEVIHVLPLDMGDIAVAATLGPSGEVAGVFERVAARWAAGGHLADVTSAHRRCNIARTLDLGAGQRTFVVTRQTPKRQVGTLISFCLKLWRTARE
jgi:hypothetical protein